MRVALALAACLSRRPRLRRGRQAIRRSSNCSRARAARPARRPTRALERFADRPDVLALNFAVDLLGPARLEGHVRQPAYTERQYAYARSLGDSGVYTPEVVVNGRAAGVGDEVG